MNRFQLVAATIYNLKVLGPIFRKLNITLKHEKEILDKLCTASKSHHPASMQYYAFSCKLSDQEQQAFRELSRLLIFKIHDITIIGGFLHEWKQTIEGNKNNSISQMLIELDTFFRTHNPTLWTNTHGPLRIPH
jgi:hypothetical protein